MRLKQALNTLCDLLSFAGKPAKREIAISALTAPHLFHRKSLATHFSRLLCGIILAIPHAYANTTQPVDEALRQALIQSVKKAESFEDRFDAEVWLVAKSEKLKRYIKDPEKRFDFLQKIHHAATQAEVDPELVLAVIQIESAFNPYAVSVVGAQGMMQVMPFWKKEIGRTDDNLIDLETNLRYGCTILKHYIDREKGHIANALARYNGSYGTYKYSRKVMNAWIDYWR